MWLTALSIGSLVLMVVILLVILGAIDQPERYVFVGGLLLFIIAHLVPIEPQFVGAVVAAIGVLLAAGSTVPLLRQPA